MRVSYQMLHFLYTGECEGQLSAKTFCDVYALADKYGQEDLKAYCLSRLRQYLTVSNVFRIMLCADVLGAEEIKVMLVQVCV